MMKMAKLLLCALVLASPTRAATDEELARSAAASVEVAEVTQDLTRAGLDPADIEAVAKQLEAVRKEGVPPPAVALEAVAVPSRTKRAQAEALGRELGRRGVPERAIHPALWAIQDRRFSRVDPEPLFAQLRTYSLDPAAIKKLTDAKIRVYAKDRTDVAEAQYEFISNSLYLPPDYLEPGAQPPRLKTQLSTSEINTVIHELDHAEKDILTNDSEVFGKNLGGAMLAGVRKVGLLAAGTGGLALALSAIPKLAMIAPVVGLTAMGALVAGGVIWGAYKWYTSRDKNPRDAREQSALDALNGIADVLRKDPRQRVVPGITEARSKAWEVSGYFMGDSVSDILEQIDTIKLHQHRRIRQAKTKAEVEAILATMELPPSIADRKFGDSSRGGSAWFRVKEVNFPYKEHPELFRQLYANSLGMQPPADARELVNRINADPALFPQLREYVRAHADRRLKEIEQAGSTAPASPAAPVPQDRTVPNYTDVPVTR